MVCTLAYLTKKKNIRLPLASLFCAFAFNALAFAGSSDYSGVDSVVPVKVINSPASIMSPESPQVVSFTSDSESVAEWLQDEEAKIKKRITQDYIIEDDGRYHRNLFEISLLAGGGGSFYQSGLSGENLEQFPDGIDANVNYASFNSVMPAINIYAHSTISLTENSFIFLSIDSNLLLDTYTANGTVFGSLSNGATVSYTYPSKSNSSSSIGGYVIQSRVLAGYDFIRFGENSAHVASILFGANVLYRNIDSLIGTIAGQYSTSLQFFNDGYAVGGSLGCRFTFRINKRTSLTIDNIADVDALLFNVSNSVGIYTGLTSNVELRFAATKNLTLVAALKNDLLFMMNGSISDSYVATNIQSSTEILDFLTLSVGLSLGF